LRKDEVMDRAGQHERNRGSLDPARARDRGTSSAWPAIEYEERDWDLPPGVEISNTQRRRVRGPYVASVTPEIARLEVRLDSNVSADADEAVLAIVRFDAECGQRLVPFTSMLLRSESTASSRIEQLTATARSIALAELGASSTRNATLIVSNVKAMQAAIDLADVLDDKSILAMHAALLEDEHPEWVGHWRDAQVWIGGSNFGPHGSTFTPPHHERVPGAMKDLVRFAQRADISPLVHAALAHAQFETVHPFPDGNGRTGRALIHSMLRQRHVARNVTVPISAGLLVDTDAYFAALTDYRAGDPNPIVAQMSDAAFASITNARTMLAELAELNGGWRDTIRARSDSNVWALTDLLMRQPAVNSSIVQNQLGVSKPTALSVISVLEDAGVLVKARGEERNRAWVALEVLDVLDRFAARSGRRAASRR
jgi:Fic family protein